MIEFICIGRASLKSTSMYAYDSLDSSGNSHTLVFVPAYDNRHISWARCTSIFNMFAYLWSRGSSIDSNCLWRYLLKVSLGLEIIEQQFRLPKSSEPAKHMKFLVCFLSSSLCLICLAQHKIKVYPCVHRTYNTIDIIINIMNGEHINLQRSDHPGRPGQSRRSLHKSRCKFPTFARNKCFQSLLWSPLHVFESERFVRTSRHSKSKSMHR